MKNIRIRLLCRWKPKKIWCSAVIITRTNVLRTENCSELMTSHALSWLAGSWRTLMHMQQRSAGGRRDRHLERMASYRKSDSVNRCVFTWRTILPNFIPIRFEATEPWACLKSVAPTITRRRTRCAAMWDQFLINKHTGIFMSIVRYLSLLCIFRLSTNRQRWLYYFGVYWRESKLRPNTLVPASRLCSRCADVETRKYAADIGEDERPVCTPCPRSTLTGVLCASSVVFLITFGFSYSYH